MRHAPSGVMNCAVPQLCRIHSLIAWHCQLAHSDFGFCEFLGYVSVIENTETVRIQGSVLMKSAVLKRYFSTEFRSVVWIPLNGIQLYMTSEMVLNSSRAHSSHEGDQEQVRNEAADHWFLSKLYG